MNLKLHGLNQWILNKFVQHIYFKLLGLNANISTSNDPIHIIFDSKIRARSQLSNEYKITRLACIYIEKSMIMSLLSKSETKFKYISYQQL